MTTTTPATTEILVCVWCGQAFTESELFVIPGTPILLCDACWKRYQGDDGEKE